MPDSANRSAILLIQTAFIGDVILATALLEYLHRTEPDTPVDFLVRKGNEGLLKGHPYVRHVLVWDKKKMILEVSLFEAYTGGYTSGRYPSNRFNPDQTLHYVLTCRLRGETTI